MGIFYILNNPQRSISPGGTLHPLRFRVTGQGTEKLILRHQRFPPLQHLSGQLRGEEHSLAAALTGKADLLAVVPGIEQGAGVPLGPLVHLAVHLKLPPFLHCPGQLLHRLGVPVDPGPELDRKSVV